MPLFYAILRGRCATWLWLAVWLVSGSVVFGQGIALRGVSAINSSMGGAAAACPIDAAGALHWNPASISGLPASEMSFGMEMILPSSTLASSYYSWAGSDSSEPGVIPVPTMAFVHKDPDSPWTWGLGVFGIGGSAVNYSCDHSNPVLSPQPLGLGQLSANVEVFQIVPTISYQLNEEWSIGFAPTVTMAKLYAAPLFLAPKSDDGTWPSGAGTRYTWGGGCQAGLYYKPELSNWSYGASIKSPQWMEPFRYKSEDSNNDPITVDYGLNYPLIASIGTAYTGFEKWVLACDVRYFDYANTPGFRHLGFTQEGAAQGLQWNSIMSVAVGIQRQMNERWIVRMGYCFNENPIDSDAVQANVASPLIIMHTASMGFSYMFEHDWLLSVTYTHCFENSVTGSLQTIKGVAIPGSSLTSTASADTLSAGVTKRF
ncbi:MAG: outer membrane protein transport protein [Planctomycetaceae bacterium]|nr:outer membrane protein transport protein [Planctomycetaceae bacterium]